MRASRVNVQWAKVATELLLLVDPKVLEVLVTKDNNAALGDEECQLVLLLVAQLRELQATDLGADTGSDL